MVLIFVVAGCKSSPKIDWNSRIGNYSYDQAVTELGPPDRKETLSDGRTVADWIERSHGGGFSFGVGTGFSTGNAAVGVGQTVGTGPRDHVLRLTFGPNTKLVSWERL
jgi:hypothetical protein